MSQTMENLHECLVASSLSTLKFNSVFFLCTTQKKASKARRLCCNLLVNNTSLGKTRWKTQQNFSGNCVFFGQNCVIQHTDISSNHQHTKTPNAAVGNRKFSITKSLCFSSDIQNDYDNFVDDSFDPVGEPLV